MYTLEKYKHNSLFHVVIHNENDGQEFRKKLKRQADSLFIIILLAKT